MPGKQVALKAKHEENGRSLGVHRGCQDSFGAEFQGLLCNLGEKKASLFDSGSFEKEAKTTKRGKRLLWQT